MSQKTTDFLKKFYGDESTKNSISERKNQGIDHHVTEKSTSKNHLDVNNYQSHKNNVEKPETTKKIS